MERNQALIGIHREKYDLLSEKKQELEKTINRHFTWGDFLLILAGLRTVDELIGERPDIAELHEGGEAEEVSSWLTKQEAEEVVGKAADRIINELKGVE